MQVITIFDIIFWISLPTVMFGGYSALMFLHGKLTKHQATFFRLGHAHAGILLTLGLVYSYYSSLTSIPRNIALGIFATGIILQSGGFFWHAFLDKEGAKKTGMYITSLGALLLVIAIILLIVGLFGILRL